jgi:cyclase
MTWSRREFLSRSLALLAAAHLPATRLARGSSAFREIRRNVGIFTARGGPIGWLVNPGGTLLVDSQFPDTAAECLAGMEERGALPLQALVNTHHHGDHTGGNGVIRDSTRSIVAHERAVELQRRAAAASTAGAPAVVADTTFTAEWSLGVGDERVKAKHYGVAHTGGDAVVVFENAGVVQMGDLVFHGAFPFVDTAGGASVRGWITTLESVAGEHPEETVFVFGHSAPGLPLTGTRADVLLQRDFLAAALATAERGVAAGRSRAEVLETRALPGFEEYVALADWLTLGSALGAAFDEVSG